MLFSVGTYASPDSLGVCDFTLDTDTGALSGGARSFHAADAKYLAVSGPLLACAFRGEAGAGVRLARRENGRLKVLCDLREPGASAPCHTAFHGGYLAAANYHEGTVFLYRPANGGFEAAYALRLGREAGCHQTLVSGGLLLVPCLEQDRIRLFDLSRDCMEAGEIPFPAGCGPRHGVLSEGGSRLWVVGERDNRLYDFRLDSEGGFISGETDSILPKGAPGDSLSAAVRLSPDERFLTVSTRGADLLTTWRIKPKGLEPVQQTSCGGRHPRDFLYTPDGRFILSANRYSHQVVCFRRDKGTGLIGERTGQCHIAQAVSLVCWKGV